MKLTGEPENQVEPTYSKEEAGKVINLAGMRDLDDNELCDVSGGGWYEDHFCYSEGESHSKKKKGLLAMTTWNGGTKE